MEKDFEQRKQAQKSCYVRREEHLAKIYEVSWLSREGNSEWGLSVNRNSENCKEIRLLGDLNRREFSDYCIGICIGSVLALCGILHTFHIGTFNLYRNAGTEVELCLCSREKKL